MQSFLPLAALAAAALFGCAPGRGGGAAIQTDGRGLFVASGREEASASGVLIAQHEAAEQARDFCAQRQSRLLLLGPLVDDGGAPGEVTVLVRFRCAAALPVGQAQP